MNILKRAAAMSGLMAALTLAPLPALAQSSTKALLGIDLTFGQQTKPELFAGLAQANVGSSGSVNGAKALVFFDFANSLAPNKFKVVATVAGRRSWQPEIGAGYNFEQGSGMFSAGLNTNHLTGGVEFSPRAGLAPYIGVQTLGNY
ncbi:MAG: hypothetical protein KGK00_11240 [Paracoccaceae bacterium]|nr:hypothetical protein [Paracoccaceae bacterium]